MAFLGRSGVGDRETDRPRKRRRRRRRIGRRGAWRHRWRNRCGAAAIGTGAGAGAPVETIKRISFPSRRTSGDHSTVRPRHWVGRRGSRKDLADESWTSIVSALHPRRLRSWLVARGGAYRDNAAMGAASADAPPNAAAAQIAMAMSRSREALASPTTTFGESFRMNLARRAECVTDAIRDIVSSPLPPANRRGRAITSLIDSLLTQSHGRVAHWSRG